MHSVVPRVLWSSDCLPVQSTCAQTGANPVTGSGRGVGGQALLDIRQARGAVVRGPGRQGRSRREKPGTFDTYRCIYGSHVEPALGALRIREVTTPGPRSGARGSQR